MPNILQERVVEGLLEAARLNTLASSGQKIP